MKISTAGNFHAHGALDLGQILPAQLGQTDGFVSGFVEDHYACLDSGAGIAGLLFQIFQHLQRFVLYDRAGGFVLLALVDEAMENVLICVCSNRFKI